MTNTDRLALFDRWAAEYDASVREDGERGFPFAGYERVLDAIVKAAFAAGVEKSRGGRVEPPGVRGKSPGGRDKCSDGRDKCSDGRDKCSETDNLRDVAVSRMPQTSPPESPRTRLRVLDVGIGTGNLAAKFVPSGHDVWGVDFSAKMLRRAAERLPGATLVQADLLKPLPDALRVPFDCIVSAYVFHEFDLSTKMRLLQALAESSLAPGGRLIIGDIAFPTDAVLTGARDRWSDVWDHDEYYWAAEEALDALRGIGWHADYEQISVCAGLFTIKP